MKVGLFAFIALVFITGTFLGLLMEQKEVSEATILVGGEPMLLSEALNTMMHFDVTQWTGVWGPIQVPTFVAVTFEVFKKTVLWDYAFFGGAWEYVRWFVFIPISIMFMMMLGFLFVGALTSIIR